MITTTWFEETVDLVNTLEEEYLIALSRVCKNELKSRGFDAWTVFGDHDNHQ